MTIHKKVLVTGCCRSGTKYTNRVLNRAGVKVKHENMGKDGTVSCFFFLDCESYPYDPRTERGHLGDRLGNYTFDVTLHQVRNPLKAIPAQAAIYSREHLDWVDSNNLVPSFMSPRILHAAHLWLATNEIVSTMADYTYRVENMEEEWPIIANLLNINPVKVPFPQEVKPHHRKRMKPTYYKPLTWQDLFDQDAFVAESVRMMADTYGYIIS